MKDIVDKIGDIKQSIKNIEDNIIGVKELTKQVGSLPTYSIPDCEINSINKEGLYKSESGIIILVTSKEIENTIEFTQYKFGDVIEKRIGIVPKNSNLTPKYSKEWENAVDLKKIEDQVNQIGTSVNKEMGDFKTAIVEALVTEIDNIYNDIDSLQNTINSLSRDVNSYIGRLKYIKKSLWSPSGQVVPSIGIYRDYYYIFKNSGSSMYIYLYDRNDSYENTTTDTYEFEFHVNSAYPAPAVYIYTCYNGSYSASIKWANNTQPPFTPGKIYQINIQNRLGVWTEF